MTTTGKNRRQQAREWERRSNQIREDFPIVEIIDPRDGSDPTQAIHDVLLADDSVVLTIFGVCAGYDPLLPPRRGPRPSAEPAVAKAFTRRVLGIEEEGVDFTNEPFRAAFTRLIGDASHRAVAARCGLGRMTVYRLARGEMAPDRYFMEQIARAYRKEPTFFREYRTQLITDKVMSELAEDPRLSLRLARRLEVAS